MYDYTIPNTRLRTNELSFIPSTIRLWNSLENETRSKSTLTSFKSSLKPNNVRHQCLSFVGNRKLSILHARLRHNCSILNYDLFRCNLVNNPSCECGNPCENVYHYFFDCPLYQTYRNNLFRDISFVDIIELDVLLFGANIFSPDENDVIFRAVQRYIRDSGRF